MIIKYDADKKRNITLRYLLAIDIFIDEKILTGRLFIDIYLALYKLYLRFVAAIPGFNKTLAAYYKVFLAYARKVLRVIKSDQSQ